MNRKALQAEEAYLQSLEIYRQLMDKNTDDLLPDLAIVLNNLGVNYRNNRKMLQAEAAFLESLQIYRQLTDKNSDIYLHSMAVTLNNLGANYRDNRKMPQAEAAYLEALQIYRQLMDKNSDGFLSGLAMTLDNLGIFYCINQKMTQAEAPFLEALKIGRQLADKNPDAFLHNLGVTLNNLGIFFEGAHNYKTVLEYFEEAMYIFGGRILSGRTHHLFEWERVLYNIRIVKDSAQLIKDYKNISYASRLLAEGYDKLKEVDERLKLQAIFEYSDLSWWALFAKDYAQSEKAALRCLELDSSQKLVLANLGHSQLLKDQYNLAFTNYEKLKGKKNREGKDYKQVLLDGLNALEAEGISHKDFAQARAAIEKW